MFCQIRDGPHLHFEYPVTFADARVVSGSTVEYGADVLQRSVELAIDAFQLTALADLTTDVKTEASGALRNDHFSRARRYFRRHCPLTLHHGVLNEEITETNNFFFKKTACVSTDSRRKLCRYNTHSFTIIIILKIADGSRILSLP